MEKFVVSLTMTIIFNKPGRPVFLTSNWRVSGIQTRMALTAAPTRNNMMLAAPQSPRKPGTSRPLFRGTSGL